MRRNRLFRAAVVVGALAAGAASRGDVINSVRDTTSSETWNTAGIWSDGAAPSGTNDYVTTNVLRTASGEFAGNSLTFNSGGVLATKQASQSEANLTMNDGSSIQQFHADNATDAVGGNLTVHGTVGVIASGTGRNLTISASVAGDGTINQNITSTNGRLTVSSTDNTGFTGSWKIMAGLLKASGSGSLGSFTSVTMNGGGLDADYDVNVPTGSLVLSGGAMTLDQAFTVGALTINGDVLGAGTYTFDQLNAAYDARFVDGGTGSITVVPEPVEVGVIVVAAGVLAGRQRRGR